MKHFRFFSILTACVLPVVFLAAGQAAPVPSRVPSAALLPQNAAAHAEAPNRLSAPLALALVEGERDKYWLNARREIYRSAGELTAQHQAELERGLRFSKLLSGDPRRKQIALTFDDGPHALYTPQLLAILKRYSAKATFFVVGEQAEKYPDLIKAEIAAGDSVGNHTYDHVSLIKIPSEYASVEIKACGEVLTRITGKPPHLFRPPGGEYDDAVALASEALGYTMVLWTDDPGDYASPGASLILSRTLAHIHPGAILLLHDGIPETLQVLPQILESLRRQGYQTVTIEEMLREQPRL